MNSWEETTWKDTVLGLFIVFGVIGGFFGLISLGGSGRSTPSTLTTTTVTPIVHDSLRPVFNHNPVGTTRCRDGWISHSTGRGTCSHHGGE